MDKLCRSKLPVITEGLAPLPCVKPRPHKSRFHSNPLVEKRWEGGINTTAHWEYIDDGYMSEGDWQSWGRLL